jgi:hypothetical protein
MAERKAVEDSATGFTAGCIRADLTLRERSRALDSVKVVMPTIIEGP